MSTSTRSDRLAAGQILVIATIIALLISLSGSALKSTVQVYFLPIAESFGQTRGALAWATTAFAVGIAVAAPLVGALADRIRAVQTLVMGTAAVGVTMILCSLSSQLWMFIIVYGLVVAFAFTMISGPRPFVQSGSSPESVDQMGVRRPRSANLVARRHPGAQTVCPASSRRPSLLDLGAGGRRARPGELPTSR